ASWPRAPPPRRRTAGNRPARAAAAPRRCALQAVAGLGPRRPRRDYQYSRADPTTRRPTRQDDAARRGARLSRGAPVAGRALTCATGGPIVRRQDPLRSELRSLTLVTIVAQSQRPALSVPSRPAVEVESNHEGGEHMRAILLGAALVFASAAVAGAGEWPMLQAQIDTQFGKRFDRQATEAR